MADIVNTVRGPKFFPSGTIRGLHYVIPVAEPSLVSRTFWERWPNHAREHYRRGVDGEWHWSHTETSSFQKYPDPPPPPEHPLPEGV